MVFAHEPTAVSPHPEARAGSMVRKHDPETRSGSAFRKRARRARSVPHAPRRRASRRVQRRFVIRATVGVSTRPNYSGDRMGNVFTPCLQAGFCERHRGFGSSGAGKLREHGASVAPDLLYSVFLRVRGSGMPENTWVRPPRAGVSAIICEVFTPTGAGSAAKYV